MARLTDEWNNCYTGAHQKVSPEEFRKTFCDVCMNPSCQNSKGVGTAWARRMATQADELLNNPNFADPNDPEFRQIREMDFESMIQEALAIHISEQRGDWSVPDTADIGREAAKLVGATAPDRFLAKRPEPAPPEKLVDEQTVTGLDGKPVERPPKVRGLNETLVTFDDPQPEWTPQGQWKVRGDSGKTWEVRYWGDGGWECTCPSHEEPCKHVRRISQRMSRAPQPPDPTPTPQEAPRLPELPPGAAPPPLRLSAPNTRQPQAGIMVGGGPPPRPEPEEDPWAPPPAPVKTVKVGGRVSFGSGKKKGKR